ncbi:hypothetical protein CONLIGDRAFT_95931 [Coniochaeta ligniaria NRRL 30616]|uniref:F-box domain-containing protein n=1 Tax=Coniochaeta ligniaria NRRL 30616 TaxID=1408157 RepID=A0A1J7J3H3_9PEZI|nr:hypothetical protein CONLIGDRAFT_95931 [Coniochaeta ligniaria NRRL 30616]
MQLTLHDLQRTMDPWIAAQVSNANHSPMCRLPEELLLNILDCIGDDLLTLYCLRHVSRKFRRLVKEPAIAKVHIREPYYKDVWRPLQERLQRDGLCAPCKVSRQRLEERLPVKPLDYYKPMTWKRCKFEGPEHGPRLYCHGCGSDHDQNQFSAREQGADKQERICLARQGAVQLCQHVHIPWATIESHISSWQEDARRRGEMDWETCFGSFRVECYDPSHDTRCTSEGATSWPRARLVDNFCIPGRVSLTLSLEWNPHGGIDAGTLAADNRYRASELRTLFAKHRLGPASILFPSCPSNPLPEMACFNSFKCTCIHYETGDTEDKERVQTTGVPEPPSCVHPSRKAVCPHYHNLHRWPVHGINQEVSIERHGLRRVSTDESPCLVTRYKQRVHLWLTTDSGNINPPHNWLHAMDPDTYDGPVACHDLPICKDKGCMNYYRRPRSDCAARRSCPT